MEHSPTGLGVRGVVGKQVVLPWRQSIHICAANIRMRFGRSIITLLGVVLATAFMASVMTTSRITERLIQSAGVNTLFSLAAATGLDVNDTTARDAQRRRDHWLIGLSVLVALVGIANSVLMSVTERIREIGTMKCLGALDVFIIRLFFLESAFSGLLGSTAGAIIGIALATGRLALAVGWSPLATSRLPQEILSTALFTLGVGTTISVLAAIYPAYLAARMQPVDAMRNEAAP